MVRIFTKFEDIEEDLRANAPEVVYKYRSWNEDFHKDVLRKQAVWFAHPFDLDDPLDVRPDTVFNNAEFNDDRYLQKLINSAGQIHPEVQNPDQLRELAIQQWEHTKANPDEIIQAHKQQNLDKSNFDSIGVFSTTINSLSMKIWDEYGDKNKGFCIGLKTVELCKQMKSGYGYVTYSEEPYKFSFFSDDNASIDILYLKKPSWQHEEEFRFITVGAGIYTPRLQNFTTDVVADITLGSDIPQTDEQDILKVIGQHYPGIPVYKIEVSPSGALTKNRIK